ncbi:hypothetical protein H0H93_002947 [Arthromyces matolae]|nr:hypothetical protein H0H93_002947 [Arthromyces matolae]
MSRAVDPARKRISKKFHRLFSIPNLRSQATTTSTSNTPDLTSQFQSSIARNSITLDPGSIDASDTFNEQYKWAIVYENQRGMTLFSIPYYSPLGLLPSDPPPFTKPDASMSPKKTNISLDNYPLPDGTWRWVSKCWMIDMRSDTGQVQHDGFEYNWMFRAHKWRAEIGSLSTGAWVRRRRWIRLMMRPAQNANLENGASPASVATGSVRQSAGSLLAPIVKSPDPNLEVLQTLLTVNSGWTKDDTEGNWFKCRLMMKSLGRDGRKLEVWKAWLSQVHDNEKDVVKGRQPVEEGDSKLFPTTFDPVNAPSQDCLIPVLQSHGTELLRFPLFTGRPSRKTNTQAFLRVLQREFGLDGFALAMTVSIGGGAALRDLWNVYDAPSRSSSKHSSDGRINTSPACRTFIANLISSSIGIILLQAGRQRAYRLRQSGASLETSLRTSHTLDLTLLLLVRAFDSLLQKFISRRALPKADGGASLPSDKSLPARGKAPSALASQIDAMVFWACSARIMWCFFYEPERLPRSYLKWISTLANLDGRVVQALQLLRNGSWSYIHGSTNNATLLTEFSKELGHNPSWGDPASLPAYGGRVADKAWKVLNVQNRRGVGGLPCELVHGSIGSAFGLESSCIANSTIRGAMAFMEAIVLYLPAHFLPILLTSPKLLLQPQRTLNALLGTVRSAAFLSSFVTLYWSAVCLTRSLILARALPWISHDFWDGPLGCIFAGSMLCGSSIWIENGRRRGEMALYVLPRAIRTYLPDAFVKARGRTARGLERIAFVLSFSTLVTAAVHQPDTLRGLSRWTLSFIINGSKAGFWKQKRQSQ